MIEQLQAHDRLKDRASSYQTLKAADVLTDAVLGPPGVAGRALAAVPALVGCLIVERLVGLRHLLVADRAGRKLALETLGRVVRELQLSDRTRPAFPGVAPSHDHVLGPRYVLLGACEAFSAGPWPGRIVDDSSRWMVLILVGERVGQQATQACTDRSLRRRGFDPAFFDAEDPAAFSWAIFEVERRLEAASDHMSCACHPVVQIRPCAVAV